MIGDAANHVRWWISASVEGDAAIASAKMLNLFFQLDRSPENSWTKMIGVPDPAVS